MRRRKEVHQGMCNVDKRTFEVKISKDYEIKEKT